MDKTSWEKRLGIEPGQPLTAEERIESLKNILTALKKSREKQVARDKILDAMAETMAKMAKINNSDNEAVSRYWQQVAIERKEFGDRVDKIINELRNRNVGNSQSQ